MRLPFNGNFRVTQLFGVNPQDYAQFGMKGHNGIDYGLPTGTPVVAATAGTAYVLSDPPGFGDYVQVVGKDYKTIYAHLQKATISNGQQVVEGQQIGVSDNTGNSSGPHLHFGVKPIVGLNNNNGFFGAIDPQPILNQGTTTMPVLDLARARILAFTIGGRNGQDGKPNALNGDCDAELTANHVGRDPYEDIWAWYVATEGNDWITKRLPGIYQRASDLASQAQTQQAAIDSLNKQLKVADEDLKLAHDDLKSTQDALEAAREAAATEPPKDTTPPATTPQTEPTLAPTWFAGFVEWLKSLIKQSK